MISQETGAYAWLITKDFVEHKGSKYYAVGQTGPNGHTLTPDEIKEKGEKFRMMDDDGKIYYHGFLYENDDVQFCSGFQPLWDFGMPFIGCTIIQYKNKEGEWKTL